MKTKGKGKMKLWLLRPIEGLKDDPWESKYSKSFGFVMRAKTEEDARKYTDVEEGEKKDQC
jgi:hypothetical protein